MPSSRISWRSVVLLVVLPFVWLALRPSGEPAPEPVDWRAPPVQTATTRAPIVLATRKGRITLEPRAAYDLSAVVASTERYWIDPSAFLSPLDAALVWGPVGDPKVRKAIDFYQANRFCIWSTGLSFPRADTIHRHFANVHLLPATRNLRRALLSLDPGDPVRLTGLLVDATGDGGFRWATSLVRDDEGPGSCEVLWVERAQVGRRVYW